ncbi:hypothetical protein ABW19_dt0204885 [Dactylella cylindrospora]|nr:hypothetical protein ABW19_dt0204885 [Dactylella cylindrospora]
MGQRNIDFPTADSTSAVDGRGSFQRPIENDASPDASNFRRLPETQDSFSPRPDMPFDYAASDTSGTVRSCHSDFTDDIETLRLLSSPADSNVESDRLQGICQDVIEQLEHINLADDASIKLDAAMAKNTKTAADWSRHFQADLNSWIAERRRKAQLVIQLVEDEVTKSGDTVDVCYKRVSKNWVAPDWEVESVEFEEWLLPLETYRSFFDEISGFGRVYSEQEARESRKLRQVFKSNFEPLLKLGLETKDSVTGHDFRSLAVHVVTVEWRFGPTHFFTARAILRLANLLFQLNNINTPAIILLTKLAAMKLERLGLNNTISRLEVLELYVATVALETDEQALFAAAKYYYLQSCAIGEEADGFKTAAMVQLGKSFIAVGDEEKGVKLLRAASDCLRQATDTSQPTETLSDTANSLWNIGTAFRKINRETDAISSFESAEQLYLRAGGQYKSYLYDTAEQLGQLYTITEKYDSALDMYGRFLVYRAERFGMTDTRALNTMRMMADILNCRGLMPCIQPILEKAVLACQKKGKANRIYYELLCRVGNVNFSVTVPETAMRRNPPLFAADMWGGI